ncbi:MAG: hypothetical protein M3134_08960 [Actinomycetota bacterium]|nr:hypothetical protein [Actinomycetota bacterium]
MRRASAFLSMLVLLIGGASTALAPAALAGPHACDIAGEAVPPAGDDCWAVVDFVNETWDRQADNVFYVFCTVFPDHSACA